VPRPIRIVVQAILGSVEPDQNSGRPPKRAGARIRREVARAALRAERPRSRWGPEEKRTLVLGILAAATTAAVAATEVGRVWRRGSAPLPSETSMPEPCLAVPKNPWCPKNNDKQPPYPVPGSPAG